MELFDGHKAHMPTGSGRRRRRRRTISGQDEEAEKDEQHPPQHETTVVFVVVGGNCEFTETEALLTQHRRTHKGKGG